MIFSALRRSGAYVALTGMAVAALVAASAGPVAADQPYPIRLVDHGIDVPGHYDVTGNGDYAVVIDNGGATGYYRVDTATGAKTMLTGAKPVLSENGGYAVRKTAFDKVEREEVATSTTAEFTIPFPSVDWIASEIFDVDAAGRYVGVHASNGTLARTRSFLFDTDTETLVPADGLLTTGVNSTGRRVSDDGMAVSWYEFGTAGAWYDRWVTWDRSTDTTTTVERPVEQNVIGSTWSASPDGTWMWFVSTDEIVPGRGNDPALFRRHVATGDTSVVPVPYDDIISYAVADDGRLVFTQNAPTGAGDSLPQLFTWDGPGTDVELVTAPPGSGNADYPVDMIWLSDDGLTATFESFASNLVPGTVGPVRRLFQADLAPPSPPPVLGPPGPIESGETYCFAVDGASPGDFVGLNVTPVNATTGGFGTVHSSDDPAGATSNVNFVVGSVDPNFGFAEVGADGEVCFTNGPVAMVDLIVDELIVADGAVFSAPTPGGASRLVDTRSGRFPPG